MTIINVPLGEELQEISWGSLTTGVNNVVHISATKNEYLQGVGVRFFQEHDYATGINLLYEMLSNPYVLSETTKLFQEVLYLNAVVHPMQGPLDISKKVSDWTEQKLAAIDVDGYFKSCLHAYVTGAVASELIWGGSKKEPELLKIKTIPPGLFAVDGDGLRFKRSAMTQDLVDKNPYKYLVFTYSSTLELSPLGDGVGKVLYYVLKERANYRCMLEAFAQKAITPTLIVKADAGVQKGAVRNICKALSTMASWKTIPVPKGITVTALPVEKDFSLFEYLLTENEKLIYKLISGESVVGAGGETGQRGAQEAANLRKARALALAKKALDHINRDLIPILVSAKFGPQESYPRYSYNLPVLNKQNLASISDTLAVIDALGYQVNPTFWEENYGIDILNFGADQKVTR